MAGVGLRDCYQSPEKSARIQKYLDNQALVEKEKESAIRRDEREKVIREITKVLKKVKKGEI